MTYRPIDLRGAALALLISLFWGANTVALKLGLVDAPPLRLAWLRLLLGGVVIALTYGSDVDWVRNVVAAGWCRLLHRGGALEMIRPRIIPIERHREAVPGPVRAALGVLRVREALRLDRAAGP